MNPMRRRALHFGPWAALVFCSILPLACSAPIDGTTRALIVLDEAFSESRPSLSKALKSIRIKGLSIGLMSVSFPDGPGPALGRIESEVAAGVNYVAVVASPLAGGALSAAFSKGERGLLLLPEWRGDPPAGAKAVRNDPRKAYTAAGRAAGAYIAAIRDAGGGFPSCGAVFLETPARPRSALEAFSAAFAASSGEAPFLVREPASAADEASADGLAEAAARELLDADIRLLLVAIGAGGPAALRAAARPGLALGAEIPGIESLPFLAFVIKPDDQALAKAVGAEILSRTRGEGPAPPIGSSGSEAVVEVPAILVAGPAASSYRAGERGLDSFIAAAVSDRRE